MRLIKILLNAKGEAIDPIEISERINDFGDSYNDTVREIIIKSKILDEGGEIFFDCASRILSSFGMTRRGPFHGDYSRKLNDCWNAIGTNLINIKNQVLRSQLPRDRYILELSNQERKEIIAEVWSITKNILPFTMGGTSYGLVGASKILFSVLPEIVLPIDNAEWLHVFKTVDIGDVLHLMVLDIQKWEEITGRHLNDLDLTKRLTTLPSVYNVMAMNARLKV
jgi:hypothetical protein